MEEYHSEESDQGAGDKDERGQEYKDRYYALLMLKCEDSSSSSNESLKRDCPELWNDYRVQVMQHNEYLDGGLTQVDAIPGSSLTIRELDDDEIPLPLVTVRPCYKQVGLVYDDRDIPSSDELDDDNVDQPRKTQSCYQDISTEHVPDTLNKGDDNNTDQPRRTVSCHLNIGAEHVPDQTSTICHNEDMLGNAFLIEKEDPSKDVSKICHTEDTPGCASLVDAPSKDLSNNGSTPSSCNETIDYFGVPLANNMPTPNEESSESHTHNISPLTYQEMSEHPCSGSSTYEVIDQHLLDNACTTRYGNVEGRHIASSLPTSSLYVLMGREMPDSTFLGSEGIEDDFLPPPLHTSNHCRNEEVTVHRPDCMSRTDKMGSRMACDNERIGGHLPDYIPSINKEFKLADYDHLTDQDVFTDDTTTFSELPPSAVRPSHPQASFLGFEQELSRCEAALREAKAELREERKKQVVVDTFRKTLLEVDQMVSEELLRLNKDVERLQPLNRVAAEWARDSRQRFWFNKYNEEQQRANSTGTGVFKSYVRRMNDSEGCLAGEACKPPPT